MITISQPSAVWQQLSSMFFLLSGFFNDLLVIRVALTLANAFLLVTGCLGHSRWAQSFVPPGMIAVDTIVWSTLNLFIHGMAVIRIYLDERKINLTEHQETLWRFIYRHSGLSKAQFQNMLCPHLEVVSFKKGERIKVEGKFFIILDGVVGAEAKVVGIAKKHIFPMVSGQMFPLQNMCIDYMPTENVFMNTWITPAAVTDVTLYCLPTKKLKELSKNHEAKDAWMALLIATMAIIAERPYYNEQSPIDFVNDERNAQIVKERNPLFDPLTASEEPNPLIAGSSMALKRPLGHLWESCKLSIFLPWPFGGWPVGLRHKLPPPTDPEAQSAVERRREEIEMSRVSQETGLDIDIETGVALEEHDPTAIIEHNIKS